MVVIDNSCVLSLCIVYVVILFCIDIVVEVKIWYEECQICKFLMIFLDCELDDIGLICVDVVVGNI